MRVWNTPNRLSFAEAKGTRYIPERPGDVAEVVLVFCDNVDGGVFFSAYNTVPNDHIVLDLFIVSN